MRRTAREQVAPERRKAIATKGGKALALRRKVQALRDMDGGAVAPGRKAMYITVERTQDGFRWQAEDRGEWEAVLEAVDGEARKIDEIAWQAACDKGNAPDALLSADGWRYCDSR